MKIKIGKNPYIVIASIFACLFFSHSAYAGTSISISSSNDVAFGNIQPSNSGDILTASDTVNINTDCSAGANVYVSAVYDGSTSLINDAADSNNEIIALPGTTIGVTSLALQNNTWGFNTANDGTYYGLPTYASASDHIAYSGTDTTVPIHYGVKVTNTLTPGNYNGFVLYTATVNNSCLDYTLNFNTNGATFSILESQTHSLNELIDLETISSTSVISKTGYHLVGWKDQDNNDYGTTGTVDVNPSDTTPVTLTAQWEANTYTIKYNANATAAPNCSDTVHPTTSEGCKMADGNVYILGNSGNIISWKNIFSGATDEEGHDATLNPGICPAGYTVPSIVDYDKLILTYGGAKDVGDRTGIEEHTSALYSRLNMEGPFWSSTEHDDWNAYYLTVHGPGNNYPAYSDTSYYNAKGYAVKVLCFKPAISSAYGSTSDTTNATYGSTVSLRTNGYGVDNYNFIGWAYSSSATAKNFDSGQANVSVTTLATNTGVQDTNNATINLYGVWEEKIKACSSSVHPTTTTGCRMLDGRVWIFGKDGERAGYWSDLFWNATGENGHNAIANTGYCPSGYDAPSITVYDNLVKAYGGTSYSGDRSGYKEDNGVLYKMLGIDYGHSYWSRTEYSSTGTYIFEVYPLGSYSYNAMGKSNYYFVLCYD